MDDDEDDDEDDEEEVGVDDVALKCSVDIRDR